MTTVSVDEQVLDTGLPMHICFAPDGTIVRAGPTTIRMRPDIVGSKVQDVLHVQPGDIEASYDVFVGNQGRRLTLDLLSLSDSGEERTRMKGTAFPLTGGLLLVNFFFATDVLRGVARHKLSARHFAPFDPTVELLFVMEARDAVLAEFERLNARLEEARRLAERQATTDALTGLLNRRALDQHLGKLTARRTKPFALMQLDLDYFKSVNDQFGHAAGDYVLEKVGEILRAHVRRDDLVARVGGDEFVLIFANCDDLALVSSIADRIIAALEQPIVFERKECRISGSIGITLSSFYKHPDADRMMADADAALYLSKNEGRARTSVAAPSEPRPS